MESSILKIKWIISICLSLLLIIFSLFLIKAKIDGHFNSIETLRAYLASFGIMAPLILILIQILQVILPVLPGFLGCIVGAVLFGACGGFWVNYIGISTGSIVAYYLAKYYGAPLVCKMISPSKYSLYAEKINRSKNYPFVLFLSILLPLAPDDFLCYFSGLINMPSIKYITIILLGKPWCILFYSIFFSYFL